MIRNFKQFAGNQYKFFNARYGQQLSDIFEFPIKLVLSPFTLAFDIAGSAPRGFGIPEFITKLSYASVFVSACILQVLFIIRLVFIVVLGGICYWLKWDRKLWCYIM